VKYMLLIYMNPTIFSSLSEQERDELFRGVDEFVKTVTESGELVDTSPLADPSQTATVKVRDGVPAVTDGPYLEAKEFFCGYYVVDCASKERAIELAAMVPDAKYTAMEVRPLIDIG
jgi:hypothetical protein